MDGDVKLGPCWRLTRLPIVYLGVSYDHQWNGNVGPPPAIIVQLYVVVAVVGELRQDTEAQLFRSYFGYAQRSLAEGLYLRVGGNQSPALKAIVVEQHGC